MKTLYITDLDGTFLNSKGKISNSSAQIIKSLIEKGCLFSVATARTKATVLDMFKGIGLNCPISLMNGVMIFDTSKNKNHLTHSIDNNTANKILEIYRKYNKHPMLYFDKGEYLEIVYTELDNVYQKEYVCDRKNMQLKKFRKVDKLTAEKDLLYIVSLDKPEELEGIYREISALGNITSNFYKDNYTDCNFLETMSAETSKGKSAVEIKKLLGADRLVVFGDNLNDIPLFEAADEAYAVSNAHPKLKSLATEVISSNDEDAVAHFILKHFNNN